MSPAGEARPRVGGGSGDHPPSVVVDTNVFVGAGFSRRSASAAVVRAVREGRLRMPWTDGTRGEIETVLRKIPPLDWGHFEDLFLPDARVSDAPEEGGLEWIPDLSDRKFAALARSEGAVLVSNDDHFLARRDEAGFPVETPGEFRRRRLG